MPEMRHGHRFPIRNASLYVSCTHLSFDQYPPGGRMLRFQTIMLASLFEIRGLPGALAIGFALILLAILIISFRSRAVVFCQYLRSMTGIQLEPADVRKVFRERGKDGVRELFLDLIIREDLKDGPLAIPSPPVKRVEEPDDMLELR